MPLNPWEKALAVVGLLLLSMGVAARLTDTVPRRQMVLHAEGYTVPVTVLDVPTGQPIGAAVLFHGLGANRGLMTTLGRSLAMDGITAYLLDLSGHGDNTDPFSFENVERCAAAMLHQLAAQGAIRPQRTVLIGHSMGGDIVLRLAAAFPASTTVAISPGPLIPVPPVPDRLRPYSMPERLPRNLLVFVGSVDLPMFEWAAHKLEESVGGARQTPEDFRAGNAFAVRVVPWASHTGLIFRNTVFLQIAQWTQTSWGQRFLLSHNDPRSPLRFAAPLGVILLFPLLVSLVASWTKARRHDQTVPTESAWGAGTFFNWAVVCLCAVLLLRFVVPLGFVRIATGGYLASLLLLVGLSGLVLWRPSGKTLLPGFFSSEALVGGLLGMVVILALGLTITREFGDLWMNAARWWRFIVLLPLLAPYFLLEETLLGPLDPPRLSTTASLARRRWIRFFLLRGILWLSMLVGLIFLGGAEILIMVMGLVFIGFSTGQRLASDMLRRRFGSIAATAAFGAVLGAWFLAAVFPLVV